MVERFLLPAALRDLISFRRLLVAAVLIIGPSCVAVLIRIGTRGSFDGVATYGALVSLLVFGFVLPILAVVFGTGAVTQEIEQKTIVYLLTRPVHRWRILLAKYIAAWLSISVTGVLGIVLLSAVTYQSRPGGGSTRLYVSSLRDPRALLSRLQTPDDTVTEYLRGRLSQSTGDLLDRWDPETPPGRRLLRSVLKDLNRVIVSDRNLYTKERFGAVQVPEDARQLIADGARGPSLARLNRLLIEAAFPDQISTSRTTRSSLWRDVLVLPVGAAAYGAFFLLLATLFQRALIFGLFLAFGWESWVPMLPGNFKLVSVMTYLRALAPHARPETPSMDLMQLFAALSPDSVPASVAWMVLGATTAGALVLAMLVFSWREYVPKDDSV